MWCHQQVDSLLWQVGPHSVYLPLQVDVTQMLRQDSCGRAPQTCQIKSARQRLALFTLTSRPSVVAISKGFFGFFFFFIVWVSPDASLISRAVRIRAISVEVKCTVLSSAMGMFILTNRWEEGEQKRRGSEAATIDQQLRDAVMYQVKMKVVLNCCYN